MVGRQGVEPTVAERGGDGVGVEAAPEPVDRGGAGCFAVDADVLARGDGRHGTHALLAEVFGEGRRGGRSRARVVDQQGNSGDPFHLWRAGRRAGGGLAVDDTFDRLADQRAGPGRVGPYVDAQFGGVGDDVVL